MGICQWVSNGKYDTWWGKNSQEGPSRPPKAKGTRKVDAAPEATAEEDPAPQDTPMEVDRTSPALNSGEEEEPEEIDLDEVENAIAGPSNTSHTDAEDDEDADAEEAEEVEETEEAEEIADIEYAEGDEDSEAAATA